MELCVLLSKDGQYLYTSTGPSHGTQPRYYFTDDLNKASLYPVNKLPKGIPKGLLAIIAEEHRTVTFIVPEES